MPLVVLDLRSAEDSACWCVAVQALAEGKIVAFPTETVYGLAASALSEAAVRKLVTAKHRDPNRPLALAVRMPRMLSTSCRTSARWGNAWRAAAGLAPSRWWSTIIIPKA